MVIEIGIDSFHFTANGAHLWLEAAHFVSDEQDWTPAILEVLDALLSHDLRIRLRRTLFGGRAGAVWIPGSPGAWNGDLWACRGRGEEVVFPNWAAVS
ncbi:MAG: hypothetical protein O7A71_09525 [Chloroflexi bacterium]|nr:hypothetical protein [Chloroflexota bacterium]